MSKEAMKLALEEMKIGNYNSAAERLETALAEQPAQQQEWIETACALIKAADDAAADSDYMLDSNDCIKVLRGQWKGPLMNDQPAAPQPAQQGPEYKYCDDGKVILKNPEMLSQLLREQPAQQRTEELLEIFKDVDQCGPLLGMGQPAPVQQEPVWNNLPSNKDVEDAMRLKRLNQLTSPPAQRKPLTDEEIWKFWWSRPEVPEGEDDSMEAEFVAAVRRVLAAHNIKENT